MAEKTEQAADKKAAAAPKSREVLSEMEQGLPSATGEQQPEKKAERAPRDNRRIVQGVQFPLGSGIETIAGDRPEDLDRLEARMTPEQCEYLKEKGAIEGDWSPSGKPQPPMIGSRQELASRGIKLGPSHDQGELARVQAENQQLRAQLADKTKK